MFITSFGEQNITYKCCSNFLIHLFTTNNVSDSQVLGDLLNQIPQDEQIDSVYTDGAYDTKQCREVIADRQAHAVIPPRKKCETLERYKEQLARSK